MKRKSQSVVSFPVGKVDSARQIIYSLKGQFIFVRSLLLQQDMRAHDVVHTRGTYMVNVWFLKYPHRIHRLVDPRNRSMSEVFVMRDRCEATLVIFSNVRVKGTSRDTMQQYLNCIFHLAKRHWNGVLKGQCTLLLLFPFVWSCPLLALHHVYYCVPPKYYDLGHSKHMGREMTF